MPLVTVTTSKKFHPLDDPGPAYMPNAFETVTLGLVDALPGIIAGNATGLGLDPDETPEDGVQVSNQKFHRCDKNVPDIWILVQFCEPYPDRKQAAVPKLIRTTFVELVNARFRAIQRELKEKQHHDINAEFAIDLFWGPGHGCIMLTDEREPRLKW